LTALGALGVLAVAGCSVGQGAPDGWRYLRAVGVAVAHPKSWRESGAGAALHGAGGRTDGELAVVPDDAGAPGPPADPKVAVAPAHVQAATPTLDGRPARVLTFAQPAPDGRPATHVEVHLRTPAGHTVLIRAWTADGAIPDAALLQEIVDSVEFLPAHLP
jgi:hypothetical protein